MARLIAELVERTPAVVPICTLGTAINLAEADNLDVWTTTLRGCGCRVGQGDFSGGQGLGGPLRFLVAEVLIVENVEHVMGLLDLQPNHQEAVNGGGCGGRGVLEAPSPLASLVGTPPPMPPRFVF
jgi:hypothetical protein